MTVCTGTKGACAPGHVAYVRASSATPICFAPHCCCHRFGLFRPLFSTRPLTTQTYMHAYVPWCWREVHANGSHGLTHTTKPAGEPGRKCHFCHHDVALKRLCFITPFPLLVARTTTASRRRTALIPIHRRQIIRNSRQLRPL